MIKALLKAQQTSRWLVTAAFVLVAGPGWAQTDDWTGDKLKDHDLTTVDSCQGGFDALRETDSGFTVEGWAWDAAKKAVPEKILLADGNDKIVGTASSGADRPDVPAAVPEVTSSTAGWTGKLDSISDSGNDLVAYALVDKGKVCKLPSAPAMKPQ